ncbi:MAG TPA: hypothetical protein VK534_02255, partial [Methylomirabilota bacterium]|nr:hypothetical protein [Methylomirabilota bacterium]
MEKTEPQDTAPKKRTRLPFQKRKQLEQDIEHITAEMYKRNQELADTNKTLLLLRTIDALVLESHASVKMVCEHISQAITQATDYPLVGLFTRTPHDQDQMRLYGFSGKELLGGSSSPLSRPLHLKISDEWLASANTSRILSLDGMTPREMAENLDISATEIGRLLRLMPLKSLYEVKLVVRRRVVGVLIIGFHGDANNISQSDKTLIDRLSETVGVALDNKLLFDENQRVLRQLKATNSKLQA